MAAWHSPEDGVVLEQQRVSAHQALLRVQVGAAGVAMGFLHGQQQVCGAGSSGAWPQKKAAEQPCPWGSKAPKLPEAGHRGPQVAYRSRAGLDLSSVHEEVIVLRGTHQKFGYDQALRSSKCLAAKGGASTLIYLHRAGRGRAGAADRGIGDGAHCSVVAFLEFFFPHPIGCVHLLSTQGRPVCVSWAASVRVMVLLGPAV